MNVTAVPSIPIEIDAYSIADSVIHSLLEFQPELWGLPPFGDCMSFPTFLINSFHIHGYSVVLQRRLKFIVFQGYVKHYGYILFVSKEQTTVGFCMSFQVSQLNSSLDSENIVNLNIDCAKHYCLTLYSIHFHQCHKI